MRGVLYGHFACMRRLVANDVDCEYACARILGQVEDVGLANAIEVWTRSNCLSEPGCQSFSCKMFSNNEIPSMRYELCISWPWEKKDSATFTRIVHTRPEAPQPLSGSSMCLPQGDSYKFT